MIPEEIAKLIKWEPFPKDTITGGQTCGIINTGTSLIIEDLSIKIFCGYYRSQMKNKQACVDMLEWFLINENIK